MLLHNIAENLNNRRKESQKKRDGRSLCVKKVAQHKLQTEEQWDDSFGLNKQKTFCVHLGFPFAFYFVLFILYGSLNVNAVSTFLFWFSLSSLPQQTHCFHRLFGVSFSGICKPFCCTFSQIKINTINHFISTNIYWKMHLNCIFTNIKN